MISIFLETVPSAQKLTKAHTHILNRICFPKNMPMKHCETSEKKYRIIIQKN